MPDKKSVSAVASAWAVGSGLLLDRGVPLAGAVLDVGGCEFWRVLAAQAVGARARVALDKAALVQARALALGHDVLRRLVAVPLAILLLPDALGVDKLLAVLIHGLFPALHALQSRAHDGGENWRAWQPAPGLKQALLALDIWSPLLGLCSRLLGLCSFPGLPTAYEVFGNQSGTTFPALLRRAHADEADRGPRLKQALVALAWLLLLDALSLGELFGVLGIVLATTFHAFQTRAHADMDGRLRQPAPCLKRSLLGVAGEGRRGDLGHQERQEGSADGPGGEMHLDGRRLVGLEGVGTFVIW